MSKVVRLVFLCLVVAAMWLEREAPLEAALRCSPGGASIRDNFDPLFNNGWYCSVHPGDANHTCLQNSQAAMCADACAICGGTLLSTNNCTHERSAGSAGENDPTAIYYGCANNEWAQYYDMSCNCSYGNPCNQPGAPCANDGDCCSGYQCSWMAGLTCVQITSPILIDLSSPDARYDLTAAADGVDFDIAGTGTLKRIAWTSESSEVAFLVLDRNGNGRIDNGTELFGNATLLSSGQRAVHGFEALKDLESGRGNGDGVITAVDAIYGDLAVWTDRNHNALTESDELSSLSESGVKSIATTYRESRRVDRNGNEYRYRGEARVMKNGRERRWAVVDVFLNTDN